MSDVDRYSSSNYCILYKRHTAINKMPTTGRTPPGPRFPYFDFKLTCTHYGPGRKRGAGIRNKASLFPWESCI